MTWSPPPGGPNPSSSDPRGEQPYPPYGAYPPPAVPGTNILALLSLVFAFVFAPVGIVLGHMARRQLRTSGEQGAGLAKAGLIIGYVLTALWVLACVGWVLLLIFANTRTNTTTY